MDLVVSCRSATMVLVPTMDLVVSCRSATMVLVPTMDLVVSLSQLLMKPGIDENASYAVSGS